MLLVLVERKKMLLDVFQLSVLLLHQVYVRLSRRPALPDIVDQNDQVSSF